MAEERKEMTKEKWEEMWLSKTTVGTNEQCPKKLLYYKTVPWDDTIKSPAMERGVKIHDMFDDFYKKTTKELRSQIKTQDHMIQIFLKVIFNIDTEIENVDAALKEHADTIKYPDAIRNFARLNEKFNFEDPMSTEEKFFSKNLKFMGIVDRIQKDGNELLMLDYKTGKINDIEKYRPELAGYSLLAAEKGHKIDYWGIYFVDHDVLLIEAVIEREIIDYIAKIMDTHVEIKQYVKFDNFPRRKSWSCRFCQYKKICEDEQR